MSGYIVIFVTCATKRQAEEISRALLGKRLAACVNISDVQSMFRWKGKVERAKEVQLIIKTVAKNYRAVERSVRMLHSYEVPEIIAIPIASGSGDYLSWISSSVKAR